MFLQQVLTRKHKWYKTFYRGCSKNRFRLIVLFVKIDFNYSHISFYFYMQKKWPILTDQNKWYQWFVQPIKICNIVVWCWFPGSSIEYDRFVYVSPEKQDYDLGWISTECPWVRRSDDLFIQFVSFSHDSFLFSSFYLHITLYYIRRIVSMIRPKLSTCIIHDISYLYDG